MPSLEGAPAELVNRIGERETLLGFLQAVREGKGRALVLSGDAGIGKTALLDDMAARARGFRVLRVSGMQSEMELAFAGLHQLCGPMLERVEMLPKPQQLALRTAFGLAEGPPPARFLIGMAVLSLLSEVSRERPLLCVTDDLHWLDRASAQTLGFVARRLGADPIGMVFGARTPTDEVAGVPALRLDGLAAQHAHELLATALTGPLDMRVRDQIVAETRGNPLALLELPRTMSREELAGGFGFPGTAPLSGRIEESFARQLDALPGDTRLLICLASAEPSGEAKLIWRAASLLGISHVVARPAMESGLADFGHRISFRHPLLRRAAYRLATAEQRRAVHRALAESTDPIADPDRRAWHRAQSTDGPDEDAAADLERSASRAQARGGPSAAAAFLEQAAALTVDPARRSDRLLAAAHANLQAGSYERVLELLAIVRAEPLTELQSARADLLRGNVAFTSGLGNDAPPLLLQAAKRLEPLDLNLARETYLKAWMAAMFAGDLAIGGSLADVSRAALALPVSAHPDEAELVLDALARVIVQGPAAAAPVLRRAISAIVDASLTPDEVLRWGWFAHAAAIGSWDFANWRFLLDRELKVLRTVGAFDLMPIVLAALGTVTTWSGEFATSAAMFAEAETICEATGAPAAAFGPTMLACLRGDEQKAVPLLRSMIAETQVTGQGASVTYANWVAAVLYNGLGRYPEALAAAVESSESSSDLFVALWSLPELVEAATRVGDVRAASAALARLAESTTAGGTDVGLGLEARSRALLSGGDVAERHYREAVERLGRTPLRPELGRAHLLYGEWLRRDNRRVDARHHLKTAHEMFTDLGMRAFAERARRELLATGERVRQGAVDSESALTAQETLIVRLASDGLTNTEIGAQLFLSARTVEWHLRKVYGKLGITSRRQLAAALRQNGDRPDR
ncbi:DNA-binding CsgD family transcriptional regulator [Nonomuraea thailandensis]|uniref:DNA-binding CsgD family transcriptional regulator n=1 Tax=Nonomuraea thailandensis TaxID=1188745 RepID=A0A9X2GFK9_9ACTN|nr:LuxR family transcriptional regulator [Nonomuraea thailandensis]MCP2356925.1 DNA-binding CsgD family transcriptional regulator [Nonomuraea thailandensis]